MAQQDPLSSVYRGVEGSGHAQIFGQSDTRGLDALISAGVSKSTAEQSKLDTQLGQLGASMQAAWEVDFPDLQSEYDKIVVKLKEYEGTKNKADKRDKWYQIQRDFGALRQKVYKSRKDREEFIKVNRDLDTDKKFLYPEESDKILNDWANAGLERPTTIPVKAASTIDAVQELSKRIKYQPKEIITHTTSEQNGQVVTIGKTRQEINEDDLRSSIKANIPFLPQNLQIALTEQTKKGFYELMQSDPSFQNMSLAEKTQAFNQYVEDSVLNMVIQGYKQVYKDLYVTRSINKSKYKSTAGGLSADGVVMALQKTDDAGTYKIKFSEETSGGAPKKSTTTEWEVSGADLLKINPNARFNGEPVDKNKLYAIKGTLKYLKVNENDTSEPVLGIVYDDLVAGILKQYQVIEISATDNEAKLKSYVADWKNDVFVPQKKRADDEYTSRMKKSGSSGVSSTPADRPRPQFNGGRRTTTSSPATPPASRPQFNGQ